MKAPDMLTQAAAIINDRAADRDPADGERSMAATVAAFNALYNHDMTTTEGWMFMVLLKASRATTGTSNPDHYIDGPAYFALAGEEATGG